MVTRAESGFFSVLLDDGRQVRCRLRGPASRVERTWSPSSRLVIASVSRSPAPARATSKRCSRAAAELVRRAAGPGRKRWLRQALAANLDLLVVVTSIVAPEFNAARLDRFLVVAEDAEIPPAICVNKCDLATGAEIAGAVAPFVNTGYPLILTSVVTGEGLPELRTLLEGRRSAFVGVSGAGKSSLLNALLPGSGQRTGDVNSASGRGRHTTTVAQLLALDDEHGSPTRQGCANSPPGASSTIACPGCSPKYAPLSRNPAAFPPAATARSPAAGSSPPSVWPWPVPPRQLRQVVGRSGVGHRDAAAQPSSATATASSALATSLMAGAFTTVKDSAKTSRAAHSPYWYGNALY